MTKITDEMVECWRINYCLDKMSPADAMRHWHDKNNGWAPAGAVAALGLVLDERERVMKLLNSNSADLLLMAGEMTKQELRTVNAVLGGIRFQAWRN